MDPIEAFKQECKDRIAAQATNTALAAASREFSEQTILSGYSYNFTWMGRPIIQYPQDMIAMQEIIWEVKPDLIIETGVAHGGSLIYYASIMELIGKGEVVGIDIDIREHNRKEIEKHPMFKRIKLLQGSSTDRTIIEQVRKFAAGKQNILVALDSNHTYDHVMKELQLYSSFVTQQSYLVVFDTIVEYLPVNCLKGKPWGPKNSPATAVNSFLQANNQFVVDKGIDNKLMVSVAPGGYLKRIK